MDLRQSEGLRSTGSRGAVAPRDLEDFKALGTIFAGLAWSTREGKNVSFAGSPERVVTSDHGEAFGSTANGVTASSSTTLQVPLIVPSSKQLVSVRCAGGGLKGPPLFLASGLTLTARAGVA